MDRTHRLFSLRPRNPVATEVLSHPCNADLVSKVMTEDALDIGHFKSNATHENERCIATLGRDPDADIVVPEEWMFVSGLQCKFLDSTCIEFLDTSSNVSCQAYKDENGDKGLLSHNCRQAYSSNGLARIKFQIDPSKSAEFDIIWQYETSLASALEARRNAVLPRRQRAMADTRVLPATDPEPESQRLPPYTAVTSPTGAARFQFHHRPLGRGAHGAVYKVKDLKTKQIYAAKKQRDSERVRREIEIVKSLGHHPNIVHFHGLEFCGGSDFVNIFMGLMEGSLDDMVKQKRRSVQLDDNDLAKVVYHDVLKGLDYIHSKGFVHRDLKPANILWTRRKGKLSFCIADFGVSNWESQVKTACGTFMFLAPEFKFDYPQTTAIDLWSLLITVLWTANLDLFRDKNWTNYSEMLVWVASLARRSWDNLASVQELVVLDPKDRATASQMLVKVFGGQGLTTRREDVPKLPTVMAPERIKKAATGEAIWLYQLVRPGDMPAQEPIDDKAPGNHIFERPVIWPDNKAQDVQVVDEQFGGWGGIVVAPKGKVSKDCPRSPVAGLPRVTKQRAPAFKRLVLRKAVARGIRSQTQMKSPPASGAWLGQLQQTPGFLPG